LSVSLSDGECPPDPVGLPVSLQDLVRFGPSLSLRRATIRRIGGGKWQVQETLPQRPTGE